MTSLPTRLPSSTPASVATDADRKQARIDRALTIWALLVSSVVYGSLIVGSFEGLTTWADETLGWHGWQKYVRASA